MRRQLISLTDAWDQIQDGDMLLWRGFGLISFVGKGVHYHASKMARWGSDIMVLDMVAARGGDVRLLETDVSRFSGLLDWFEVNPHGLPYDREGAVRYMRRLVDQPYGYFSLLRASIIHLPFIRRWITSECGDDDFISPYPPFCSEAVAGADRIGGGYDPVPWCPDRLVEPSYLARSDFYRYRGTLVSPELAKEVIGDPLTERKGTVKAIPAFT